MRIHGSCSHGNEACRGGHDGICRVHGSVVQACVCPTVLQRAEGAVVWPKAIYVKGAPYQDEPLHV